MLGLAKRKGAAADNAGRISKRDPKPFQRLFRFAVTGGVASVIYAVVTLALIDELQLASPLASVLGYLAAIPVSFWGQKTWTFQTNGEVTKEFARFLLLQAVNILLAALVMALAIDFLGFDRRFGIAAVVVLIPIITYVCLARLVFTLPRGS
ncbi:MAG: GtrA family protein [Hyphomicrobium sp.]